MKEDAGGDNLAVGWKLPNEVLERPIPGSYLSYDPAWADFGNYIVNTEERVLRLFPNPAGDFVNLTIPSHFTANSDLRIINIYGSVVKSQNVTESEIWISLEDLPSGFYVVAVTDGKYMANSKMIKE
jgi:hypothetical protein